VILTVLSGTVHITVSPSKLAAPLTLHSLIELKYL